MTRLSLSSASMTSNPVAQKIPNKAWKNHFRHHGLPFKALDLMDKPLIDILSEATKLPLTKPEKKIGYWICIASANPDATVAELLQLANKLSMKLVHVIEAADLIEHHAVKATARNLHIQQQIEYQQLYKKIGDDSTELSEFAHSDVYTSAPCVIL